MDTKFSTAIHSLILISESDKPMSSEEIAHSVGTNSSYIRKVLSLLKKENIISSRQGISGFKLLVPPEDLNLLKIYNAVNQNSFFDIHKHANDECIVGKYIYPTLSQVLSELESSIYNELEKKTLADCIDIMRNQLTPEELKRIETVFSDPT